MSEHTQTPWDFYVRRVAACVEALFWLDCTSKGEEACAMKLAAIIAKAEAK